MQANITLTHPDDIAAAMEAFNPSKDGASPTGRLLNGQFDQSNLQEWTESGTIHGKQAVVFYLFDNTEAENPDSMSFDAGHAFKIEISICSKYDNKIRNTGRHGSRHRDC